MSKITYAKNKYVGRTARKARLVVDLIRGKMVNEAVNILKFTNKGPAGDVLKTVNSAISNAVHNQNLSKDNLVIAEAYVNEAPTLKRGMFVGRGRYHQIFRRNCHIVIGVSEVVAKKPVSKSDSKKADQKKVVKNSKSKVNK